MKITMFIGNIVLHTCSCAAKAMFNVEALIVKAWKRLSTTRENTLQRIRGKAVNDPGVATEVTLVLQRGHNMLCHHS